MGYPHADFVSYFKKGAIFYFADPEFLRSLDPHYFICIGKSKDGSILYMSCCTSQIQTIERLIELNAYSHKTFVRIAPNRHDNPFTTDTYVNCNEYFEYSESELHSLNANNQIAYYSTLPAEFMEQIAIGLQESIIIPNEIKELVVKPSEY